MRPVLAAFDRICLALVWISGLIAAFVMGLVTFGLGLLNVPGIVMSIFIGMLLIGVIALPRLIVMMRR